jgi:hypothetical protein
MVFSYLKIPSFFPKYKYFTPLIPRGLQGILVTVGKKYGPYPPKSRVFEKMSGAAFKEKVSQRQESYLVAAFLTPGTII